MGNKQGKSSKKGGAAGKGASSGGGAPAAPSGNDDVSSATRTLSELAIQDNLAVGKYLKSVPLLARLTDQERNQLGGALELKEFKAGTDVFRKGDAADGFYIVKSGEVDVWIPDSDDTSARSTLATLSAGDYFGETALQSDKKTSPRGATVSAVSDCRCYFMDAEKFAVLFDVNNLHRAVNFVNRRIAISAEQESGVSDFKAKGTKTTMSDEVKEIVAQTIDDSVLFASMSDQHKVLVGSEMLRLEVSKGEEVIKQGSAGVNFYAIESGSFDFFVKDKSKGEIKVASRGPGESFGELALMYNAPRAASVRATSDAVLWSIDRYTFRRIAQDLGSNRLQQYIDFMKGVPLLSSLSNSERAKLAEALEEVTFQPDEVIFSQGATVDMSASMYVVATGSVSCWKDGKEVKRCKVGDVFGEKALLENVPRAATVKAHGLAHCLRLDRPAFNLLLGPLEDLMKRGVEAYQEVEKEEKFISHLRTDIPFGELKKVGVLGNGSFGHVTLVKHERENAAYALKAVSKQQICESRQRNHILSEKRVLATLKHPFIIRLHATYKDADRLYFLLEVSLGGELFTVLRKHRLFPDTTAQFYAGCVILAFEYMHTFNIIYRDLKPENLLLDAEGYIKVTDFGFAKKIKYKTDTLCGTPEYLAPEIVAGFGHGKGVDWWTVGILIFEMLASYTPFYHEDNMHMYARIAKSKVKYPAHFSKEARTIVRGLLTNSPLKRLGVIKGGPATIKEQSWFKGFQWDKLFGRTLKAPIIPKIKDPFDLSNFDDYGQDGDGIQKYEDDGSNWEKDF